MISKVISLLMLVLILSAIVQASIQIEKENSEGVLMFYQNGDNKLSPVISTCQTLIEKVGATEEVKIAVLIDKKSLNDTKLYYYEGVTPIEQDWELESDMGDPNTIVQFVNKVQSDYPANHYYFEITANKGSGWQGISYDDHSDGIMITMPELFDAFDEITDNGCMKLDSILVQSCLCGNLEFRYQIRQFCHYFIGYADCGLVGDIPFDKILEDVINNPMMDGNDFALCCVDHFNPIQYQNIYQAFSATESIQLDNLADTLDDLSIWMIDNMDSYKEDIESALDITRKYGLAFNIDYYCDIQDFLSHLITEDDDLDILKQDVNNAIQEAVISCTSLVDHPSCGFNMYFPPTKQEYNEALRYDHSLPSTYEETLFAQDTHWDEFLRIYLDIENNLPPTKPQITGENSGKIGSAIEFTFSAVDPNNDDIYYFLDWGDGISEWTEFLDSGDEISVSHIWNEKGSFDLKAKSIDQFGEESDWETLSISVPKTKEKSYSILKTLFIQFQERFPFINNIIK